MPSLDHQRVDASAPGLIVHSDRDGQYCGNANLTLLYRHEALRSQTRRGECCNNVLPGTTQAEIL